MIIKLNSSSLFTLRIHAVHKLFIRNVSEAFSLKFSNDRHRPAARVPVKASLGTVFTQFGEAPSSFTILP